MARMLKSQLDIAKHLRSLAIRLILHMTWSLVRPGFKMNVLEHIQFNDATMGWTLHKSIIELSFLKTHTIQRVCQLTWTLQNPSFKTHAVQQLQGAEMTWVWHKSSFGSTFLNALTIQWMQQLTWTLRKPMLWNWMCSKRHTVQGHVDDLCV